MNRADELKKLHETDEYDILIIGGGATGLGCAVDAASRGYKTLLLEKYDFAKGTSSKATKLVHGGVRYLPQGNFRSVREALLERGRLLKNAPHVCRTIALIVPAYKWWQKWYYGIGLTLYEWMSGAWSLGKTQLLSRKQTLKHLPGLSENGLQGAVLYFDGQFDDSRLAINLAQTAIAHGATVINYFGLSGFKKENGKLTGVIATDSLTSQTFEINAKVIINATGVFADAILQMAEGHAEQTIAPSQGIHLVVNKHFFKGNMGMMIPKTDDGRVLFIIPWHEKLLIGTTDTAVKTISIEPIALQEEIDFIIDHFNRYSSSLISRHDVQSVFVGLRPLAKKADEKKTALMPRDHVIKVMPSGLIQVTGGKWTTYRSMAEHLIDEAQKRTQLPTATCKTKELKIHGWASVLPAKHFEVYGSDGIEIKKWIEKDESLAAVIHPQYPYTKAEVKWVIENEMCSHVEDVLARRIRLLFLDAKAAIACAPAIAKQLAAFLGKDADWEKEEIFLFNKLAQNYIIH